MKILLISLMAVAAPLRAADKAADKAPAPANSSGTATNMPGQPHMDQDPETSAYQKEDFEQTIKQDIKQMDSDLKETEKTINASFDAESELEKGQYERKLAFRKAQRDAKLAFEKNAVDSWKGMLKKLKDLPPTERSAEKVAFDAKASDERRKFYEGLSAKSREFAESQNDERQAFWGQQQKKEAAARRMQREHETKAGAPTNAR